MILLDTNVVSEPLRPAADPAVIAWLDEQVAETLYLSAVSIVELRYGVAALPGGRRKNGLAKALEEQVIGLFGSRILAFDAAAAQACADIRVRARNAGRGIGLADSYIAGIAKAQGLAVATRDVAPYAAAGVAVIDPWKEGRTKA